MSGYSTHWRATIFAAIALHFLAAIIFSWLLPHLAPEKNFADVAEIEFVDVDLLPPDVTVIDAQAIPSSTQETLPTFNAADLVLPEIKIPEPIITPPPEVIKEQEIRNKEQVQTPNSYLQTPNSIEPPKEVVAPKENHQRLARPPVTIKEVYPEQGSVLGYRGYVSFAARLGKDGKVKSTEILQSSGRYFVDEIARKAAMQWTFRPALDESGRPMECDKIITFDFTKERS